MPPSKDRCSFLEPDAESWEPSFCLALPFLMPVTQLSLVSVDHLYSSTTFLY